MHLLAVRCLGIASLILTPLLIAAPRGSDSSITPKQAHQRASRLCETLHDLPARRKQECCGARSASLAALCTTTLAESLSRARSVLDADAVADCAESSTTLLRGCDWVGPLQPALPQACMQLISGRMQAGAACRSSLECRDGLYCQGMSPFNAGICAAPAPVGARCELPADQLAAYARAEGDPRHPSCAGICLRGRCLARLADGGACSSSAQCADARHCIAGQCRDAPLFASGSDCASSAECSSGNLCIDARCTAPKPGGASCRLPFECRSLECRRTEGDDSGVCVDSCAAATTL
jgi:hypothetical protein